MKIKPIEEIKNLCVKFAEPLNLTVKKVEFKQGKNPELTVYITKEGGVDLDACASLHNAINEPLDELDVSFGEPYTLNVSSLGIDWAFETEEDFLSHIGQKVEIKLKTAIKGKKQYDAVLLSYNGSAISFRVDEKTAYTVDLKNVIKVNEFIDFN